jgi:hypothetical protein
MSSGGPPTAMQGPLPPDEDRGPRLEAAYWTWSAVSILMLCLRLYARVKIRGLGWDDWMMLITVVCVPTLHSHESSTFYTLIPFD